MKRLIAAAALSGAVILGGATAALAADQCQVLMCMSGISGNGSALPDCQPAINYYFSILRYGPHGINIPWTVAARLAFLNSYVGSDLNQQWVTAIQAKWGGAVVW